MASTLCDSEEVLFRQVHPNALTDGVPGSHCFMPTDLDDNLMSLDRSSITTAEAAFRRYTSSGAKSAAVFGVSVLEFSLDDIACVADPVEGHPTLPDNPAHALADFSAHRRNRQKVVAKRLKSLALLRGCLFSRP